MSRAVHLELVLDLITQVFIKSLKKPIARRRVTNEYTLIMQIHVNQQLSGCLRSTKSRSFTVFFVMKTSYGNLTYREHHNRVNG